MDILQKAFEEAIKEHANALASENDIVFLNPHEFLCTKDGCKNMIGNFPIYSDYHHFSDWGSRYLSGIMLEPVLKH